MKKYGCFLGITAIVLMLSVTASMAETRYISDQLVVSLREAPQKSAKSLTYLRTDAPVEVLEESEGHVKVKTEAGEVGYIKANYLTTKTPKATIIKQLRKERDRLASRSGEMKQKVAASSAENRASQKDLSEQLAAARKRTRDSEVKVKESEARLAKLAKKHQALQKDAKEVIAITKERDDLRKANQALDEKVAKLDAEAQSLLRTGAIKWFLAGSGVLFFGWIIGKMSGGRRRRGLM
ncbi:MAG: TIGR04211 family SH3 domain-containing protein [Desulfuromonadales bacterium]|nr:TIGR04211 family SH3 domain-containing protein [Desulfuromonadales bacterium]